MELSYNISAGLSTVETQFFEKALYIAKKDCYNVMVFICAWARSSAGRAKGSVFCQIYNFILLYSSVPLLELLIWARSSVWESQRNITRARSEQQTAQTEQEKIYKTTKYGPIAQLGERGVRIAEVEGSIPLPSTKTGNRCGFYHGDFSFDHRNTTDGFWF